MHYLHLNRDISFFEHCTFVVTDVLVSCCVFLYAMSEGTCMNTHLQDRLKLTSDNWLNTAINESEKKLSVHCSSSLVSCESAPVQSGLPLLHLSACTSYFISTVQTSPTSYPFIYMYWCTSFGTACLLTIATFELILDKKNSTLNTTSLNWS